MALTKRQIQTLIRNIEREKAAIAKHRDNLRELVSDVEGIMDNCETAVDDLHHAADALSELL